MKSVADSHICGHIAFLYGQGAACPPPPPCKYGDGTCKADPPCVGQWEPAVCQPDCAERTFVISQEAAEGGRRCDYGDGAKQPCALGEGLCARNRLPLTAVGGHLAETPVRDQDSVHFPELRGEVTS